VAKRKARRAVVSEAPASARLDLTVEQGVSVLRQACEALGLAESDVLGWRDLGASVGLTTVWGAKVYWNKPAGER